MTVGLNRNRIMCALVIALVCVCGGFVLGFVSSLHLKSAAPSDLRHQYLLQAGDAPPSVRTGVLAALRVFQEGYLKRDPNAMDSFMYRLFPETDEVLLMGTDATEWVRGHRAVREFIKADWLGWEDFRFAVDDSIVWSSGDVAWIASIGLVHGQRSDRPVRFSAILVRNGRDWLLRNVHFQWDERDPRPSDLLHPSTYLKLAKLVLQVIMPVTPPHPLSASGWH
jgi:SnoaL-like protein